MKETVDKSFDTVRERELHFRDQKSGFVRQADTHTRAIRKK